MRSACAASLLRSTLSYATSVSTCIASAVARAEKRSLSAASVSACSTREAEHAAGVADGGAAAVGDLLAHHRRVLAAVALVHVLQHLLAVAVREVDVDVGRLAAVVAQESLEEEIELDRIDGGDAEAEAHSGVGGGAAPLAEHPRAVGEADDVPHDEEVAGEAEPLDERELVRELRALPRVDRAPTLGRALRDEPREIFVGADAGREWKRRERGMQIVQPERAALGDCERRLHAIGVMTPALRHPRGTLQPPLGVGAQARAHLVERALVAQRREHVVHDAPARASVVDVVGDDPRHVERA